LDWAIFLSDIADEVSLVHRRKDFRGALDSVEKVAELSKAGKINLITDAEVKEIHGEGKVSSLLIQHKTEGAIVKECDHFVPLFGLSPKLGPIGDWGLEIEKNAIVVNNALDYSTNIPGVFAIGDVNTYPGKLKLILSGFPRSNHRSSVCLQHHQPRKAVCDEVHNRQWCYRF
jgi:thioredoxin reductase (NADPH)